MKQETYKKLKGTTEYRAYIALGMQDTTTQSELEKGIIIFADETAGCDYTFNLKSGYARRSYWKPGNYFFPAITKISYQLNPRERVTARGGEISWTKTFPNNMKKLLSIGLSPAIRYNAKRRMERNKELVNMIGEILS